MVSGRAKRGPKPARSKNSSVPDGEAETWGALGMTPRRPFSSTAAAVAFGAPSPSVSTMACDGGASILISRRRRPGREAGDAQGAGEVRAALRGSPRSPALAPLRPTFPRIAVSRQSTPRVRPCPSLSSAAAPGCGTWRCPIPSLPLLPPASSAFSAGAGGASETCVSAEVLPSSTAVGGPFDAALTLGTPGTATSSSPRQATLATPPAPRLRHSILVPSPWPHVCRSLCLTRFPFSFALAKLLVFRASCGLNV